MRSKHNSVLSFDRSSPVWSYWVAHCEGFKLRTAGGRRGTVEAVVFETPDQPRFLIVRIGFLQRKRMIPIDAVEEIFPAAQLLVLSRRPGRVRRFLTAGGTQAWRVARGAPPSMARATLATGHVLGAAVQRLLVLLAAVALTLARGARRAGRTGSAAAARAAPVVRRASLVTARALRTAGAHSAAAIRQAAAAAAVGLREGGRRGRAAATRLRTAAEPRARAGAESAVRAAQGVNNRLEGPLLRLHQRFAPGDPSANGNGSAPGPLLPRSFRPPARSARRPDSPTPSTTRRSS